MRDGFFSVNEKMKSPHPGSLLAREEWEQTNGSFSLSREKVGMRDGFFSVNEKMKSPHPGSLLAREEWEQTNGSFSLSREKVGMRDGFVFSGITANGQKHRVKTPASFATGNDRA